MPNAKFSAHAITFSDGATSYNGVSRTAPRFPTVTFPLTKFGYPLPMVMRLIPTAHCFELSRAQGILASGVPMFTKPVGFR